jgi:hypothetical protein
MAAEIVQLYGEGNERTVFRSGIGLPVSRVCISFGASIQQKQARSIREKVNRQDLGEA